jgi:hypothetical protein
MITICPSLSKSTDVFNIQEYDSFSTILQFVLYLTCFYLFVWRHQLYILPVQHQLRIYRQAWNQSTNQQYYFLITHAGYWWRFPWLNLPMSLTYRSMTLSKYANKCDQRSDIPFYNLTTPNETTLLTTISDELGSFIMSLL